MPVQNTDDEGSLVDFSSHLASVQISNHQPDERGRIGQFFTSPSVAHFMANMFDISKKEIRILDPGAGTGVLTAALCEKILLNSQVQRIHIDVFENDVTVIPFLEQTMIKCKERFTSRGIEASYTIIQRDFVIETSSTNNIDWQTHRFPTIEYDFIISNPPYYKIHKKKGRIISSDQIVASQPNVYTVFMVLSLRLLSPEGQMVFITPRSYCSGLYYRKFREWFLSKAEINWIHIFESRKQVFDKEKVLQENVIIKVSKLTTQKDYDVHISVSKDKNLATLQTFQLPSSKIIYRQNGDVFIRIPSSKEELRAIEIIDHWTSNLHSMGFEISTGPVVDFRTDHLCGTVDGRRKAVPLLWMNSIRNGRVHWINESGKKPQAIEDRAETSSFLLPMQNYVIIKRFTSKEQIRRLDAGVLLKGDLPFDKIGLENHLNYIYRVGGELTIEDAFGIATLLNSKIVDYFFRSLNGNTQVNATEIRAMPFPPLELIRTIGKETLSNQAGSGLSPDEILEQVLEISGDD